MAEISSTRSIPAVPPRKPSAASGTGPKANQKTSLRRQPTAKPRSSLLTPRSEKQKRPILDKELVKLYRGIASMLKAQINTGDALQYYAQGLPNKDISKCLLDIKGHIDAGVDVHEAFRKSGRFDDMTIGLIHAGSDSGQLAEAFNSLAKRLKTQMHFRSMVFKAVAIPSVVICLLIGAFIFAQVQVTPQVQSMLRGSGMKPDAFTGFMFKVSELTQNIWPMAILFMIITILIIKFSTKVRNVLLNFFMSRWRLLSQLIMGLRQLTFLGTIHMLHSNGIDLAKSIRVGAESVCKTPLHDELLTCADKYQKAAIPVSEAFRKFTSCDAQVAHMLSVGEKSASLDTQLGMLTEMYENDTNNHMEAFTNILNIIVLVIAVTLIGAVVLGTFMPIFLMGPSMMQGARN